MEEWRNRASNDRSGYVWGHSSICTCPPCERTYESHNAGYEACNCSICYMQNMNRNVPYQSDERGQSIVATVNFCERCDSMGKSLVMGKLAYRTDASKGVTDIEICPGCVDDFMTWLKSDVMTSRERAYKEPWKENTEPAKQGTILTKETLHSLLRELDAGDAKPE